MDLSDMVLPVSSAGLETPTTLDTHCIQLLVHTRLHFTACLQAPWGHHANCSMPQACPAEHCARVAQGLAMQVQATMIAHF
eukprot:9795232-Alexandrium_andersonii.AAC.1